jgi:hypothetical protein
VEIEVAAVCFEVVEEDLAIVVAFVDEEAIVAVFVDVEDEEASVIFVAVAVIEDVADGDVDSDLGTTAAIHIQRRSLEIATTKTRTISQTMDLLINQSEMVSIIIQAVPLWRSVIEMMLKISVVVGAADREVEADLTNREEAVLKVDEDEAVAVVEILELLENVKWTKMTMTRKMKKRRRTKRTEAIPVMNDRRRRSPNRWTLLVQRKAKTFLPPSRKSQFNKKKIQTMKNRTKRMKKTRKRKNLIRMKPKQNN